MKRNTDTPLVLLFLLSAGFFLNRPLFSQKSYDSLNLKLPKHYFKTTIVLDGYNRPNTKLDTLGEINRRLEYYGVKQFNLSFCIPVMTRETNGKGADSNVVENSHLLLTGNFLRLRPQFGGISQHVLTKRGIGMRYIYNTGKKGVLFFDAAPFVTRDISFRSKAYVRLAGTFIYSHNVSEKFNIRFGFTKSFLWGNRLYLQFLGLRFGALDKIHLSIQFPRNISFNIPFGSNAGLSIYTAPQGGMFNFANNDTLYYQPNVKTFHFTRYEINTGLRFNARLGSKFGFFICTGFSTRNTINFYSENANRLKAGQAYFKYFYSSKPSSTLFAQLGLVLRFGKTRSFNNNRNIYDAIDMNSKTDINDGNSQIPVAPNKKPRNPNLESIQDLIDYNDF